MAFDGLIVETMLPRWPVLDSAVRRCVHAEVARSVKRSIGCAPAHVRIGVAVLSFGLGSLLLVTSIGAGGPAVRAARAERLYGLIQKLPGPAGAAVRLYRSMSVLAFYEHASVAPLLDPETPEDRQTRFRLARSSRRAEAKS